MSATVSRSPVRDTGWGHVAVRRGLLAFVAVLIAETAWILAVPPFRGTDEFDHAFRAAGVASGQWHLGERAKDGRGMLVWVPSGLVTAASAQCAALPYTLPGNCHAIATRGSESEIATAAGQYNPLFYWVMGTVAKPFRGASALYAMRIFVAVLCAFLMGLGAGLLSVAGTGRWATLGLLTAITPEVLFSGSIVGPNGVEMGLALVLWGSLVAIEHVRGATRERTLLLVAFAAAVPLAFLRQLGPLWIAGIVLTVALWRGLRSTRSLVARHRGLVAGGVAAVVAATGWALVWMHIAARFTVPRAATAIKVPEQWGQAFWVHRWVLQMVGAFPFRDVPAPLWVYPLALLVICLLAAGAWRRATDRRRSRLLFWTVLVWLAVPIPISLLMMPTAGAFWQGRYELPFFIGILPLCGLLLDEAGFAPFEGARIISLSAAILVAINVASVVHVERLELSRAVSVGDPAWIHPSPWVTAVIMLTSCATALCCARVSAAPPPPDLPSGVSAEASRARTAS